MGGGQGEALNEATINSHSLWLNIKRLTAYGESFLLKRWTATEKQGGCS